MHQCTENHSLLVFYYSVCVCVCVCVCANSLQHCKHFKRGAGTCPFGNSCFYRHGQSKSLLHVGQPNRVWCVSECAAAERLSPEYLDGTKAILPPKPRPRPRVAVDDFESHR